MRKDAQGHPIVDNLDQVDDYLQQRQKDMDSGALFKEENGTITVDHLATAKHMIWFINSIPKLDKYIKKVLIMRIGSPAMNGKKMSHLAIALNLRMSVEEVKELELAGIAIAEEWMRRTTFEDGARSNESNSLPNEILNTVEKIQR